MKNLDLSQVAAVAGGVAKLELSSGILFAVAGAALVTVAVKTTEVGATVDFIAPTAAGAALALGGILLSVDAIVNAA